MAEYKASLNALRHKFHAAPRLGEVNIFGAKYPTYGKKGGYPPVFKIRKLRTKFEVKPFHASKGHLAQA